MMMDAIMLHTSRMWDVNRQSRFPTPTSGGCQHGEAAWGYGIISDMNGDRPSIETTSMLQIAVWEQPISEIALAHGIPLRLLRTRIRREEIALPPPEYWDKLERGLSRNQTLREIGWTPPMIRKINDILRDAKSRTIKQLRGS
jgi:hypothetical protein